MNDPLRKCPRCTATDCDCDERIFANLLARQNVLGSGVINMDVSYRWICSMRDLNRAVIVELKRAYGPKMGAGQELCLKDLTGDLLTHDGVRFELRSFVIEGQKKGGFKLYSFLKEASELALTFLRQGDAEQCCALISDWFQKGIKLHAAPDPMPSGGYDFLDIDNCRRLRHHFEAIIPKNKPEIAHLICKTCTEAKGHTVFVAFGELKESNFGVWRNPSETLITLNPGVWAKEINEAHRAKSYPSEFPYGKKADE